MVITNLIGEVAEREDEVKFTTLCVLNDVGLREILKAQHPNLRVINLIQGEHYHQAGDDYQLRMDQEDYEAFIADMKAENLELSHFVMGQSKSEVLDYLETDMQQIVLFVKSLMQAKLSGCKWVVPYDVKQLSSAVMLTGFAKSLYQEHPNYQLIVVGLDESSLESRAKILLKELSSNDFHVRYQPDRQVQRYEKSVLAKGCPLRSGGVYLITGGLGGLGFIFAKYLAKEYQAKLILTGRSEASDKLKELEEQGASVLYLRGDVGDYSTVKSWVERAKSEFGSIQGIIHTAGIIEDKLLIQKDWSSFKSVLFPKIVGALNLDKATQEEPLDYFVMFSSLSGCLGNIGQTDYASANAFLDHLMEWRATQVEQGLRRGKSLSIDWPYWSEGGMQVDEATQKGFELSGMKALSTIQGLQAFEACLGSEKASQLVCYGNPSRVISYIKEAQSIKKIISVSVEDEAVPESLKRDLILTVSETLKLPPEALSVI